MIISPTEDEISQIEHDYCDAVQELLPPPIGPDKDRFTIGMSSVSGLGVFATRDLAPGDEIMTIPHPVLSILEQSQLADTCANCFRARSPGYLLGVHSWDDTPAGPIRLRTCGGCGVFRYCSEPCQRHHWDTVHSLECPIYAREDRCKTLSTAVRALMQLILRNDDVPNLVYNLESHLNDWEFDPDRELEWQNIAVLTGGAAHLVGSGHATDIALEMMCSVMTNSFTLVTPTYDSIGLVLDPTLARINHACDPNAVVAMAPSFAGPAITVRALTPIKAGQEVYISYIGHGYERDERRKLLERQFHFECECDFCSEELVESKAWLKCDPWLMAVSYYHEARQIKSLNDNTRHRWLVEVLRCSRDIWSMIEIGGNAFPRDAFTQVLQSQPFQEARHDLFVAHISRGEYGLAIVQGLILHHFGFPPGLTASSSIPGTSPVNNPAAVAHAFVLARLIDHALIDPAEPDHLPTGDSVGKEAWTDDVSLMASSYLRIQDTPFRWDLQALHLVETVVSLVGSSHGPGSGLARTALAYAIFLLIRHQLQDQHWRSVLTPAAPARRAPSPPSSPSIPIQLSETTTQLIWKLSEITTVTKQLVSYAEKHSTTTESAKRAQLGLVPRQQSSQSLTDAGVGVDTDADDETSLVGRQLVLQNRLYGLVTEALKMCADELRTLREHRAESEPLHPPVYWSLETEVEKVAHSNEPLK